MTEISEIPDDDAKDTTEPAEDVSSEDVAADHAPSKDAAPGRRALRGRVVAIVLAVLVFGSAGFAAWAYFTEYRSDRQVDAATSAEVVKAASEGAVAILSYAPETLDRDFAAATTHITGDFLDYYTKFTREIVTPAARQGAVKTSATVVRSGVSELKPDSAVVLVFLNQTTISNQNPGGAFATSSVKVGLSKVNGRWLISSFDPV